MPNGVGISAFDTESLLEELGLSSMLAQRQYRGSSMPSVGQPVYEDTRSQRQYRGDSAEELAEELLFGREDRGPIARETEWPDMDRLDSDDSGDLSDYGLLPRQSETEGDRGRQRNRQSETEGDRGTDRGDSGDLSDYGLLPKLPTDATYAAAAAHYDTGTSADAVCSALVGDSAWIERQASMADFDD